VNWELALAILWLLLAVPVALLIGHSIRRADASSSVSSTQAPTDVRAPWTSPDLDDAQPARRPRAR
jgi:hypothetical protein